MSDILELRMRGNELMQTGQTTVVTSRVCSKPDVKGVLDIIMKNESISMLTVRRVSTEPFQMKETFFTTTDSEFNKEARAQLIKQFSNEKVEDEHGG